MKITDLRIPVAEAELARAAAIATTPAEGAAFWAEVTERVESELGEQTAVISPRPEQKSE